MLLSKAAQERPFCLFPVVFLGKQRGRAEEKEPISKRASLLAQLYFFFLHFLNHVLVQEE